jgi:hypothetical protein
VKRSISCTERVGAAKVRVKLAERFCPIFCVWSVVMRPRRAARRRDPPITMNTVKPKRRPTPGGEPEDQQPPPEVIDRHADLLPEGAVDAAVQGLKPEELSGPGGLLSQPNNQSPRLTHSSSDSLGHVDVGNAATACSQMPSMRQDTDIQSSER